jgi:hypothetical protein
MSVSKFEREMSIPAQLDVSQHRMIILFCALLRILKFESKWLDSGVNSCNAAPTAAIQAPN